MICQVTRVTTEPVSAHLCLGRAPAHRQQGWGSSHPGLSCAPPPDTGASPGHNTCGCGCTVPAEPPGSGEQRYSSGGSMWAKVTSSPGRTPHGPWALLGNPPRDGGLCLASPRRAQPEPSSSLGSWLVSCGGCLRSICRSPELGAGSLAPQPCRHRHLLLHHLLVARDLSGVEQLVHWRVLVQGVGRQHDWEVGQPAVCLPRPTRCPEAYAPLLVCRCLAHPHPAHFVLRDGAGVNESLRNDSQDGIHVVRDVHVEDQLWVLQSIHPESQQQAGYTGQVWGETQGLRPWPCTSGVARVCREGTCWSSRCAGSLGPRCQASPPAHLGSRTGT